MKIKIILLALLTFSLVSCSKKDDRLEKVNLHTLVYKNKTVIHESTTTFNYDEEQEFSAKEHKIKILPFIKEDRKIGITIILTSKDKVIAKSTRLATILNHPARLKVISGGNTYGISVTPSYTKKTLEALKSH